MAGDANIAILAGQRRAGVVAGAEFKITLIGPLNDHLIELDLWNGDDRNGDALRRGRAGCHGDRGGGGHRDGHRRERVARVQSIAQGALVLLLDIGSAKNLEQHEEQYEDAGADQDFAGYPSDSSGS